MMKQSKFIIGMMLLLAAGLPVGCSHDVDLSFRNEIAVRTGVTGMQKRVQAIDNNTALQADTIKIDAYFHDSEEKYLDEAMLVYVTDHWRFDNGSGTELHYYWPIEGSVYKGASDITVSSLDFVGFCPYDKPAYIGEPAYNHSTGVSFTCDMSKYMNLAGQDTLQEYVIGYLKNQTYADQVSHSGVPLQFKHPLAQVKFAITAASGTHVKINSISIADVCTGGTCTYNGSTMTWAEHSGNDTIKVIQVLKNGGTTESTPIYVIPNNYGSKYLTVNATWDEWSNVTISNYGTNVNFNWEAGRSYTYNLTLDKYGLKVDVEKFTEQW